MAASGLLALYQAGLTSPDLVQQAQNAKILKDIAAMRAAGATDDAIRGLASGGGGGMSLAGGYGLIEPAAESARIASAYSLARAQLAAQLENDRFNENMQLSDRAAQPFNVVGYLDALERTGAAYPLNVNRVDNIAIPPDTRESPERVKLREFLRSDKPQPFARGGAMVLDRPSVLIDAYTGQPRATMAENGPEILDYEGGGNYRVQTVPGVSKRMGRGVQRRILDSAVGGDGRWSTDDVQPNAGMPGGGVDPLYGIGDVNGDGRVNSGDQLMLAQRRNRIDDGRPMRAVERNQPRPRMGRVRAMAKGDAFRQLAATTAKRAATSQQARDTYKPPATSSGGAYYGFNSAQEAMDFARKTAGASEADRRYMNETAMKRGSTGNVANVRTQAGAAVNPDNAVIRILPNGTVHIDQSNDPNQKGSVVYDSRSGRTVTRPATAEDFAAYNNQKRHQQIGGASIVSSKRGAIDPFSDDPSAQGLRNIIDMNNQYGAVPLRGFTEDGQIAGRNGAIDPGPYADTPYIDGYTPPSRAGNRTRMGRTTNGGGTQGSGSSSTDGNYTDVQRDAAKLVAALGNNTLAPPEFVSMLQAGQVPGVNLLTPLFWSSLDDTQKQIYAGLLTSTGWVGNVSDIERAVDRQRPA